MPKSKKEWNATKKTELIDLAIENEDKIFLLEKKIKAINKKNEYLEKKLFASLETVTELYGGVIAHQNANCRTPMSEKEIKRLADNNIFGTHPRDPFMKEKTDSHSLMIDWIAGFVNRLRFDYLQYSEGDEDRKTDQDCYLGSSR